MNERSIANGSGPLAEKPNAEMDGMRPSHWWHRP